VGAWTERRLIEKIRKAGGGNGFGIVKSIGDDCCEVTASGSLLLSTDSLVEGVHFDSDFHPPHLLGRKSIAVNISDIAAMGGTPRFILLSLCLPAELEWDWISAWLDGVFEILDEYNCVLIGGDTVKAAELVIGVTVIGEPVAGGAVYRSGAAAGDTVWVTGPLGSAGGGLKLLTSGTVKSYPVGAPSRYDPLLRAHLDPVPLVSTGKKLAGCGFVTAMQDISDGIATDLAHICKASGVAAYIDRDLLPFLPELSDLALDLQLDPDALILSAGEDYQLVFTVKKGCEDEFVRQVCAEVPGLVRIGLVKTGEGVFLNNDGQCIDIRFQGYEH